jgi:hypothetical protein
MNMLSGLAKLAPHVAIAAASKNQSRNQLPQPRQTSLRHASEAERGPELMSVGDFADRPGNMKIAEMPLHAQLGLPKWAKAGLQLKDGTKLFKSAKEAIDYARRFADKPGQIFHNWTIETGRIEPMWGTGGPRFGVSGTARELENLPTKATGITDMADRFAQRNPSTLRGLFEK